MKERKNVCKKERKKARKNVCTNERMYVRKKETAL